MLLKTYRCFPLKTDNLFNLQNDQIIASEVKSFQKLKLALNCQIINNDFDSVAYQEKKCRHRKGQEIFSCNNKGTRGEFRSRHYKRFHRLVHQSLT